MITGYDCIGLQYYGECWSGPNACNTYRKYGKTTKCWNGVGLGLTNYVYISRLAVLPTFTSTLATSTKSPITSTKGIIICIYQVFRKTNSSSKAQIIVRHYIYFKKRIAL